MHGRKGAIYGRAMCMVGQTATAVNDMHPTGMHSCWRKSLGVQCLGSIPGMAASKKSFIHDNEYLMFSLRSFLPPSEWLKMMASDLIRSLWPDPV